MRKDFNHEFSRIAQITLIFNFTNTLKHSFKVEFNEFPMLKQTCIN
jgi:hypothetical protein